MLIIKRVFHTLNTYERIVYTRAKKCKTLRLLLQLVFHVKHIASKHVHEHRARDGPVRHCRAALFALSQLLAPVLVTTLRIVLQDIITGVCAGAMQDLCISSLKKA